MAGEPHSLAVISISDEMTVGQRKALEKKKERYKGYKKGDKLPDWQVLACPRVRVADLPEKHLKKKWIENLEQNQFLKSCCRHPENHFIEAFKSHMDELAPDIYVFHCDKCARKHRIFCVGLTDDHRPTWDVGERP